MAHPVKAIIYPVKDGKVAAEGIVALRPSLLQRVVTLAWQIARAVGWMLVGYVVGRMG